MSKNRKLLLLGGFFLAIFFIPFSDKTVSHAVMEGVLMLSSYAQEHVLLCIIPALFIAGAIMVFLDKQAIIKYLGPKANKTVAYSVASISGSILAVCSCTVLPIFRGIYKKGSGIGPAISFLYSGPAINVLAIILTARVLGWQIGLARAIGSIVFAYIIGIIMHLIFKKDDENRDTSNAMFEHEVGSQKRKLWQNSLYMFSMIAILIFLNWIPSKDSLPIWNLIYQVKYFIVLFFALVLAIMLKKWFKKNELKDWLKETRNFALQIMPLLFGGVLLAGFMLGRPGHNGLIPMQWIADLVGGNSILSNFFAALSGALMYFATLTEIPILQGLMGSGMGDGPALALLLAGPSISLPSILVINSVLGVKKTFTYVTLVVVISTFAGFIFGVMRA